VASGVLDRDVLTPLFEPAGHLLDLRILSGLDPLGDVEDEGVLGAVRGELGHGDGSLVGDHHLRELDIGLVVVFLGLRGGRGRGLVLGGCLAVAVVVAAGGSADQCDRDERGKYRSAPAPVSSSRMRLAMYSSRDSTAR
jgi:hypothetical protein